MSYAVQVQNLPFRYDMPQQQPLQFNVMSPPFVPPVPYCPPHIQQLLPAIAAAVANEAASTCNMHPGRMFLYNQLASNNFANNHFALVVTTVVDILMLNLQKNINSFPEQGLNKAVQDAMILFTSLVFHEFQALTSVTPPEIVFEANKNLQTYFSLSNEIASMKNQMFTNQNAGFNQPRMFNPSFQNVVSQPMMQRNYGTPGINTAINQPGNASIFTRNNTQQNVVVVNNDSNTKYHHLNRRVNVIGQSGPQEVTQVTEVATPKEAKRITDWFPSMQQNYPLTINPYRSKLVLEETTRNGFKVMKIVPLEEFEMDRSKHVITSMSQVMTSRIPDTYRTREESLEDNVRKIFRINKEDVDSYTRDETKEEPSSKELLSYINPEWVYESFIDASIFSGKLQQHSHSLNDPECSIYRIYRIIGNPIICSEDHTDFINELSLCKSFKELSLILFQTISDHLTSQSLLKLCYGIEKILTKEVNHVLRNKMSIPALSIDSFIDDVNTIPDFLQNNLGEIYKTAFLKLQPTYISQIVSGPTSESEKIIECCIVEESHNPNVKVNFINHSYSITYLSVQDSEIGIEPFSECASAILETEHPLMYEVVSGIFNQDKEIDNESLHNLIVTADDVIYEVQKGIIGTDIYTICHWKK